MRKKKIEAFVTIEYSLLLPVLFMMFMFLVCIGVYLHNQCVLQTNMYILAVEGARMDAEDAGQRVALLQAKEKQLYKNKYVLAENMQTSYYSRGNTFVITGSGQVVNPAWAFGVGDNKWSLSAESTIWVNSPADTLRLMKAASELLEKLPSEEESLNDS